MRITVVGRSPAWQDAGGACSGYLVEDGDTCLLVDCGSGAFSKLRRVRDYAEVDAVVITHMHADHFFDLIPYGCALTLAPRAPGGGARRRPRLLLPPGGSDVLLKIEEAGGQAGLVDEAFERSEYDPAAALDVGSLRLRFQPVPHFAPCHAVDVRCAAGGRFTFGADHGPTDALDGFADDTDLLMLEATLPRPEPDGSLGHLTAAQAGEHAARANAARLVLTHITDELDWGRAIAEAKRSFPGPVEVAREGAVYEV